MTKPIRGLHHITAVSGAPQQNLDFYTQELGLRFVKKTVNFDDPFTYHLYYGNYEATPGSALTFFPWSNAAPGKPNTGEATAVQFAVPMGSIDYWINRFADRAIDFDMPKTIHGLSTLRLKDSDNMQLEIVETPHADSITTKASGDVDDSHALRGFFGTVLSLPDTGRTAELLTEFGWESKGEDNNRLRYWSETDNNLGMAVDLMKEPDLRGRFGTGSIHHIAFRVPDDDQQNAWREKLVKMGFQVTPVQDRQYFRSIYFREHGGVLFEIATDIPGFAKDEPLESLGTELKLPAWFEQHREQIELRLPELKVK